MPDACCLLPVARCPLSAAPISLFLPPSHALFEILTLILSLTSTNATGHLLPVPRFRVQGEDLQRERLQRGQFGVCPEQPDGSNGGMDQRGAELERPGANLMIAPVHSL